MENNGITYQNCFEILLKYLIPPLAANAAEDIMKLLPQIQEEEKPKNELATIFLKDGLEYKALGYDESGAIYYSGDDMFFAEPKDIDYDKTNELSQSKKQQRD